MSNFNEFFKNKGLKIMVDRFFDKADSYNPKYKITNLKYEIQKEPPYPASYYIENGLTASHKVLITYDLNNDGKEKMTEFEVPKEIDGAFILEGAYRISTNKLGQDYNCRMKFSGPGEHVINFDYDRRYDVDRKILRLRRENADLGISEPLDIAYQDIDNFENKDALRLSDKQIRKLQIKLDIDYRPEYITTKLIQECIAFGDDRTKDLIVDKTIDSVAQGFMQFIFKDNNGRNFWSARKRIMTYFAKYNKLQEQTNSITTLCYRFWKGNSGATSKEIQVPPGVNALNLESLKSKITIPETVAYNKSMSDIIDIADTPINQNTNLQNALNVCVHLTDEAVLYDVYDKGFNKITIDYMDYLNSKVVASEYVDYENKTIVPSSTGEIEVKYRMKRKLVKPDDYDLIDLHPDYRLSSSSRRIPFVNFTDSVRISMGTSMIRQAIPLANAQRPLVDTGNYDDLAGNVLNTHFNYPSGTVKEITEDDVIIELPDKNIIKIPRRTAIQSLNDVAVWTEPKVKVGDKVKEGDVITGSHEVEKDTVKSGINTLVLYSAYKGLVHEDAVVVSESYADRMTSYSIIDLEIDIKTSTSLKWIAPIGTKVSSRQPVVTLNKAIRLDMVNKLLQEKLGLLLGSEQEDISEYVTDQNLLVPNNIDEAVVSDVMIQENIKPVVSKQVSVPDYTFARSSKPLIEEYEKTKDRKVIYDKFPEYIASDTLDPVEIDPTQYKMVYKVRVRLIKIHRLVVADKLTNRYGGKGVISAILPDSKMPIVDGKSCEIIMNPYSTINRKIPSVIMECSLGKIAIKIHDLVDVYKKTATGRKKILPLMKKYYPGRYDKMSVEDFIDLHNNSKLEDVYYFNVGCFSKYKPTDIQKMMDELGITLDSEVLLPEADTVDLEELKEVLTEEEYNEALKNMEGKFRKVEKPLMAGYVTMEQLYHIPSYSNKVTSDMITNTRNAIPIAPRGKYRSTGQKIDELTLSGLLSRNATGFIRSYRSDFEVEQNQRFLDNLLGLGLMMRDNKGYAQGGSALKTSMTKMKQKYGLVSGKGGV